MQKIEELIKTYKQACVAVDAMEKEISGLDVKRENILKNISLLTNKIDLAKTDKEKALSQFALGTLTQDELKDQKKLFSQIQEDLEDEQEMLAAVEKRINQLIRQKADFHSPHNKQKEAETAIWRNIYTSRAANIQTLRAEVVQCFVAYHLAGGIHSLHNGLFFCELFGNEDIARGRTTEIRDKLMKEYGF